MSSPSTGSARPGDALEAARADVERLSALVRDLDERLGLVLAASRTGIWEWHVADGRLVWSDVVSVQHGLEPGDAPASFEAYLEMIHPDDRQRFLSEVGRALEGRTPYSLEFRIIWPDGSVHWTHGAGRAFYDDESGQPLRMIGTGQDVTERRRMETERDELLEVERKANDWRESFIDVLSHELRTPITTILGAASVLTRSSVLDDEGRSGLLLDIASEAGRLERIVGDLVVLSRTERGVLHAVLEPVELRRIVRRVAEDEATRWPEARFEIDTDGSVPIVLAEQTYVEQVLRNMLANAAKYGGPGCLVRVRTAAGPGEATVHVVDDGPGIDSDDLARLFEPFYRAPALARQVSGSGIGLFVCARLIEAMGGRIWATPRPEGGSEFAFALQAIDEGDDEGR